MKKQTDQETIELLESIEKIWTLVGLSALPSGSEIVYTKLVEQINKLKCERSAEIRRSMCKGNQFETIMRVKKEADGALDEKSYTRLTNRYQELRAEWDKANDGALVGIEF